MVRFVSSMPVKSIPFLQWAHSIPQLLQVQKYSPLFHYPNAILMNHYDRNRLLSVCFWAVVDWISFENNIEALLIDVHLFLTVLDFLSILPHLLWISMAAPVSIISLRLPPPWRSRWWLYMYATSASTSMSIHLGLDILVWDQPADPSLSWYMVLTRVFKWWIREVIQW